MSQAHALKKAIAGLVLVAGSTVAVSVQAANEINIYSDRQAFLMQPILDAFTKETGIKVNVVFAKKGIIERLKNEGANSPADLLLTSNVSNLSRAVDAGVTQSVNDKTINSNVPAQYRDPNGQWFGLTTRARVIYASKTRVKEGEFQRYEDLADPKFKGRICTRKGGDTYNIALIASMIAAHGEAGAKSWLEGVKANLAQKPQGNDRAQVKAVKEGVCDIAIGNTYYYGHMLANEEQRAWAESVNIVYPNQADRGAHVNISGMALTKAAPHRAEALQLMRFLTENKAQKIYAEENYEFPIKAGVSASKLVAHWGDFKADKVSLAEVDKYRKQAAKLVNEVGFDN
ncbi:iron(III) transport system substrate-binding protein [Oceanospirillum multiglobuliferum]|uniref:Iron ABC transporter substrate-binding protein n=1 Tax=Oceanospirillum multiglobuliferum TaxID=64969 RepID=A0A1T4RP44_9GAMM|nr:Fe(3+) ABC transporter substrate-binding protein [Oceanospirillum multiglobuliferum]OPX54659.1 iron ABC transporter substrate-binding protein [Oceanospirillum multiglobuliferum]SKA17770.1 iron(III) transport system substrate-binding protein [Oceanospirillum multiglobuliferum]